MQDVHDLRTRRSGRTVIAQLHIELEGDMPLREAHHISDDVAAAIREVIPGADVEIHQDPVGVVEPRLDAQIEQKTDH